MGTKFKLHPGRALTEKILSLKSSVLEKSLHFESFSNFIIFVPKKKKCFLEKKKKKGPHFESVSDFMIFVSEN